MKKLIMLTLAITISAGAQAFTLGDLVTPKAQKIILPCAAGMVASQVLGQDMGVGLSICAASATFVMVNEYHNPNQEKMRDEVESFLKTAKQSLDESLKYNKEEYAVYQDAVRKIILEKLSEVQGTSEKQIEKYMGSASFEAFLKAKTLEIVESSDDLVSDRLQKAKEEIRRQVTEEVTKDVVEMRQVEQ